MSVFRKAMVYLGLVDDEEYYGDDDEYYGDDEPYVDERPAPARATRPANSGGGSATATDTSPVRVIRARREDPPASTATAARTSSIKPIPMPASRVHVLEPKGFNDAQDVGDKLKAGQPVILNLQGVDRDLQRRLIDFSSGLAYALNGTMSKAADQVFLLTPSNVEVSEEEKERLQARGLYRAARA
jgi:cell division inhibitor SepF